MSVIKIGDGWLAVRAKGEGDIAANISLAIDVGDGPSGTAVAGEFEVAMSFIPIGDDGLAIPTEGEGRGAAKFSCPIDGSQDPSGAVVAGEFEIDLGTSRAAACQPRSA